jgi:hypothetical protein
MKNHAKTPMILRVDFLKHAFFNTLLEFNPSPSTFDISTPNTYQSDCYVIVTSSDTNDCHSPAPIDYGTVTWNVIDTNATTVVADFNKLGTYFGTLFGFIEDGAEIVGCSETNSPSLDGSITGSWQQVCCSATNGPYKKSSVTGTLTAKWPMMDCMIPAGSFQIPCGICKVGLFAGFGFNAAASATLGVAQPCQSQPIIVNYSVDATVEAGAEAVLKVPDGWLSCSAKVSGSCSASIATSQHDDGYCYISGNVGQMQAKLDISLQVVGGITCTPYSGTVTLWEGVPIGPTQTDCTTL